MKSREIAQTFRRGTIFLLQRASRVHYSVFVLTGFVPQAEILVVGGLPTPGDDADSVRLRRTHRSAAERIAVLPPTPVVRATQAMGHDRQARAVCYDARYGLHARKVTAYYV